MGDTPDILAFSPDGQLAFASLRGPNPVTGAAHVATGTTPGFSVIDTARRRLVRVIQPAAPEDLAASDFHGLGVRVIRQGSSKGLAGRGWWGGGPVPPRPAGPCGP